MKLRARLIEPPDPKNEFIVVEFYEDKTRQHFAVYTSESYRLRLRGDYVYTMDIKFRSIVMPDVSGNPTYETQLYIEGYPNPLSNVPREWQTVQFNAD